MGQLQAGQEQIMIKRYKWGSFKKTVRHIGHVTERSPNKYFRCTKYEFHSDWFDCSWTHKKRLTKAQWSNRIPSPYE